MAKKKSNKMPPMKDMQARADWEADRLRKLGEAIPNGPEKNAMRSQLMTALGQWPLGTIAMVLYFVCLFTMTVYGQGVEGADTAFVSEGVTVTVDTGDGGGTVELGPISEDMGWKGIAALVYALYELLVRLIPTTKDWSLLSRLMGLLNLLVPNKVKGKVKSKWREGIAVLRE